MLNKFLKMKARLMIGLTGIILFTGCEEDEFEEMVNGGDDKIVEEEHSLDKFDQVKVKDHADLQLHHGNEYRAKIKAEEDIIDDVSTEVKGGQLVIDVKDDDDLLKVSGDAVTVHVWTSQTNLVVAKGSGDVETPSRILANQAKVHLKGSGDADITAEEKEALTLRSDGSGSFDLTGNAGQLFVKLKGSGDLDGEAFTAKKANLSTKGSGDIKVGVEESLKAATYGSGDIKFKGNPTIKHMDQDGSGDIEKVD